MKDLIKKYQQWVKKNVSPKCTNKDCLRVDRGGACGLCTEFVAPSK